MTPESIAAISERLRAATEGANWRQADGCSYYVEADDCEAVAKGIGPRSRLIATFIAHAPTDIAALLAEVARLRKDNGDLRMMMRGHQPPTVSEAQESLVLLVSSITRERDAAQATVKAQAELMSRAVKYAREDRMVTPGATRLQRVLDEMERAL